VRAYPPPTPRNPEIAKLKKPRFYLLYSLVRRLADRSDVVIENFKPGSMSLSSSLPEIPTDMNLGNIALEKWGLGPDVLRATNPGLIVTRVSGYGQTGPWSARPGYASVCEGEAGFRFINGYPDEKTGELSGPPVRPNISLGDSVAGLTAAFGTALALLARRADKGVTSGVTVDVSIMERCQPSNINLFRAVIDDR
jgi:crotonobetainyl-CoA:carnitine CoA-transferase CaiB-like acyl-CoA transferase